MNVYSTRLGLLKVRGEQVLVFPKGIWGLNTVHEYCLVPHDSVYTWLQALSQPNLALMLVDPLAYFPKYDVTISDADAAALDLQSNDEIRLYAIVTFSRAGTTANLAGPIVINRRTHCARQVVLDNGQYTCRHLLHLPSKPAGMARWSLASA